MPALICLTSAYDNISAYDWHERAMLPNFTSSLRFIISYFVQYAPHKSIALNIVTMCQQNNRRPNWAKSKKNRKQPKQKPEFVKHEMILNIPHILGNLFFWVCLQHWTKELSYGTMLTIICLKIVYSIECIKCQRTVKNSASISTNICIFRFKNDSIGTVAFSYILSSWLSLTIQ